MAGSKKKAAFYVKFYTSSAYGTTDEVETTFYIYHYYLGPSWHIVNVTTMVDEELNSAERSIKLGHNVKQQNLKSEETEL